MSRRTADGFSIGIEELTTDDLPPGDVLIQVAYAAMNYKDALVCSASGRVAQVSPLVPGLELTGTVIESSDLRFPPGSAVQASDFGAAMGVARHGGFSEYARVPSEWLSLLPRTIGFKSACLLNGMMPAALALYHLERHGLTPDRGPVLVTGATGGVGSMAVRLLAQRGYTVAASTGKPQEKALLQQLGATEILSREEVAAPSERKASDDGSNKTKPTSSQERTVSMTADQARNTDASAKYYATDGFGAGNETPATMNCESPTGEKRVFYLSNGKLMSI